MILATLLAFASNFVIVPRLGTEFVPVVNGTTATVIGEMPRAPGSMPATVLRSAGSRCCSTMCTFPEVETTYIQIGSGGGDQDPRLMTVTLGLSATKARWRTSQEIARAAAEAGAQVIPTLRTRTGGNGQGQPLQVRVFANDLTLLGQLAGAATGGAGPSGRSYRCHEQPRDRAGGAGGPGPAGCATWP